MAAAAKHLTPVTLELGGKCPVIFDSLPNSDMKVSTFSFILYICNPYHDHLSNDIYGVSRWLSNALWVESGGRVLDKLA